MVLYIIILLIAIQGILLGKEYSYMGCFMGGVYLLFLFIYFSEILFWNWNFCLVGYSKNICLGCNDMVKAFLFSIKGDEEESFLSLYSLFEGYYVSEESSINGEVDEWGGSEVLLGFHLKVMSFFMIYFRSIDNIISGLKTWSCFFTKRESGMYLLAPGSECCSVELLELVSTSSNDSGKRSVSKSLTFCLKLFYCFLKKEKAWLINNADDKGLMLGYRCYVSEIFFDLFIYIINGGDDGFELLFIDFLSIEIDWYTSLSEEERWSYLPLSMALFAFYYFLMGELSDSISIDVLSSVLSLWKSWALES